MFRYLVLCEGKYWQYDELTTAIDKVAYLNEYEEGSAYIMDIKDAEYVPVPKFKVHVERDTLVISSLTDQHIFSVDLLESMPEYITPNTPTEKLYEYVSEYLYDELIDHNLA